MIIFLDTTQIIITSEHRILEGSGAEAAACKPGSAWDRKAQTTFLTVSQSSFHTNLMALSELLKQGLFCRYILIFILLFVNFQQPFPARPHPQSQLRRQPQPQTQPRPQPKPQPQPQPQSKPPATATTTATQG